MSGRNGLLNLVVLEAGFAGQITSCHLLLSVNLRISQIVNTTPKVSAAAVNVKLTYSGQLNPSEMLSITAAIDALNVVTKHAKPDALTGLLALRSSPTIMFFMNPPLGLRTGK